MDLKGKVALVTGAGTGIGKGISLALASYGAKVAVNYFSSAEGAQDTKARIEESGGEAMVIQADISNRQQVMAMVEKVVAYFGRIDILVNNAGVPRAALILRMSEDDWDLVLDTNLKGVYRCCKAVLRPMLKARAGCIINVSSIVAIIGNVGQANYAAAKAGIVGLTKSLAKEVASRNIRVNAVAPGYIETDMTRALPALQREELQKSIPMGRTGRPEEVAAAIAFLASDDAAYITGQTLIVDGGLAM